MPRLYYKTVAATHAVHPLYITFFLRGVAEVNKLGERCTSCYEQWLRGGRLWQTGSLSASVLVERVASFYVRLCSPKHVGSYCITKVRTLSRFRRAENIKRGTIRIPSETELKILYADIGFHASKLI